MSLAVLALAALPGTTRGSDLRFERIAVEDGLAHSTVLAIRQDSLGFLWIGTQEGLNRYDGYDFRTWKHDPEDPSSLSDTWVRTLHEDRRGELWIGTFLGLNRLRRDEGGFERFLHDPTDETSLSAGYVLSLADTPDGALWVGTDDGLNRLAPAAVTRRASGATVSFERFPQGAGAGPRGRTINGLWVDEAGDLWIGSEGGLDRFDAARRSFEAHDLGQGGPQPDVLAIAADQDGALWVGTRGGLIRLDRQSGEATHYRHDPADPGSLSEDPIQALLVDRKGQLWVGTENQGLNRLDRSTGRFVRHQHDPSDPLSLGEDSILAMLEDRTGVVWFGTYAGLSKHDPGKEAFALYRQRPDGAAGLAGRSAWGICEDRSGELWVGTYQEGLTRFDRDRRGAVHYRPDPEDPGSLPHVSVNALFEDRAEALWVGTWGGLSRFDRRSDRFVTYRHDPEDPASLRDDAVARLHEDSSGRFWIGTYAGLDRFDRVLGVFHHAPAVPEGPGKTPVYAITEDRSGALWFGSDRDGLYRLDPGSESYVPYRHDPADPTSLSSDSVASIHEDSSGDLWVGTFSGGLNRLDAARQRFVRFREGDGLPNDTIQGILEDERGNLWLATNNGLARLDPRTGSFRSYDAGDGIQGAIFSSGSAFRSPSGELFFGGVEGLTAFYPQRITDDTVPPTVVLTDFLLFNRRPALRGADPDSPLVQAIEITRELVLDYRQYVVSFEFAALHFASPKRNRYAYQLEGFDPDWNFVDSEKRFAHYSNLPSGEYVFRVKASNGDGVWNEEGVSVEVRVLPPPWRTWWAWTLYVVTFLGILGGWSWRQVHKVERERGVSRRLREQAEEVGLYNDALERFTYTVSHDLKSPLFTIQGFLGYLELDLAAGDHEATAKDVATIREAAVTMQDHLEDLFELSRLGRRVTRPVAVSVSHLGRQAWEIVAAQEDVREIDLRIASGMPAVLGDETLLIQMMKHLLGNAVKFLGDTRRPTIEVDVGDSGTFFVRDNGIGIDPAYHEKVFGLFERLDFQTGGTGMGLALVKRIVETHGGRVWVESQGAEQGSTFCFTLPRPTRTESPGDP